LYKSYEPDKRKKRYARHVTQKAKNTNAYKVLVGKPEGKRQRCRLRQRTEENLNMGLKQEGIRVIQGRDKCRLIVNTVTDVRVP
jgi:hypothetical protein